MKRYDGLARTAIRKWLRRHLRTELFYFEITKTCATVEDGGKGARPIRSREPDSPANRGPDTSARTRYPTMGRPFPRPRYEIVVDDAAPVV